MRPAGRSGLLSTLGSAAKLEAERSSFSLHFWSGADDRKAHEILSRAKRDNASKNLINPRRLLDQVGPSLSREEIAPSAAPQGTGRCRPKGFEETAKGGLKGRRASEASLLPDVLTDGRNQTGVRRRCAPFCGIAPQKKTILILALVGPFCRIFDLVSSGLLGFPLPRSSDAAKFTPFGGVLQRGHLLVKAQKSAI
ncbi:hypothetical protein [Croceicoccus gelatinilyticus]|uniref:hypothetical protein n=1 Tax=Croceicoccus gelatinilyticus TaxID=2835536 RepID=UPI001BD0D891|nr:hypothetical protein [Croceicoccus gelatinilyticus]MBS7671540.1 hypothetical protein [Croceicoccus gelatinilyticus]